METKYTPGPWRWVDDQLIGGAPWPVIHSAPYEGQWIDPRTPDGRLIAAAPDAYEIIMAFIEACDDACLVESDHSHAGFADILRASFAYRAKATQP